MKRVFFATLLLAAGAGAGAFAATPTLRDAEELYFQSQVPQAETAFRAIGDDAAATPADRGAAGRDLARIQWLIDRDATAALASLRAARATGADLCPTATMTVRVLDESGATRQAALEARAGAPACPGQSQTTELRTAEAKAWLDEAATASGKARAQAVANAGAALSHLSPLAEASPTVQKLRLGWAIQAQAAAPALEAWKGFFWLTDHNAPAAFGLEDTEVAHRFRAGLAPRARLKDQLAFLSLLIRGGFYDEARRFDAHERLSQRAAGDPDYARVAAYYDLRARLDPAILAFNRATARGRQDKMFVATLTGIIAAAAHRLDPAATDPRVPLQKAFGIYGTVGETGGFASLHAGHVVQDDTLKIEQFGRRGEVRFMLIENMISNGYQGWLWDGMAQTGGWSGDNGTIVQVRSAYTPGGLRALASTEPEVAARLATRQPGLEQQDLAALARTPVAYLPGLAARLTKQATAQLAAKAHAEAERTGQPYARVFAKADWDAVVGHSITIHEGRHSLDNLQFTGAAKLPGAELEYRAKLSELMLAEFPRMPLANIQTSEIGTTSDHGAANARVFEGYRLWMDAHRDEIANFDTKVPTLEQLDKLTDAQIRAVAHGLDPQFAAKAG